MLQHRLLAPEVLQVVEISRVQHQKAPFFAVPFSKPAFEVPGRDHDTLNPKPLSKPVFEVPGRDHHCCGLPGLYGQLHRVADGQEGLASGYFWGFGVYGSGFVVHSVTSTYDSASFRVEGLGFRVSGLAVSTEHSIADKTHQQAVYAGPTS